MVPHLLLLSPFHTELWLQSKKRTFPTVASLPKHKYPEVMMKDKKDMFKEYFNIWNSISSLLFEIIPLKTQKRYPRAAKKSNRAQQHKKENASPVTPHRLLLRANHSVTKSLAACLNCTEHGILYIISRQSMKHRRPAALNCNQRQGERHASKALPGRLNFPVSFVKYLWYNCVEASHRLILAT